MLIIIVRPESQKANVWVIRVRVTLHADRPGAVTSWGDTSGPVPFRWRRPRGWRGHPMMRAPGTGRRWWLTAPGWSTGPPMMRRWPPLWRRGGTPSKPLSHAGPGGPTRGSRATPVPAVRWKRMGWVTTMWTWGARLPRAERACGTLPTVWWAAVIGNLTSVPSWGFGRRRHASRRGGWVRRRWRPSDPCPMSIRRGPLAGSTVSTCVTASSLWTGLMLSPWRLSVVRGTQLPQCVGAHVLVSNRGTHGWLRWSVTYELFPTVSHVLHKLLLPPFNHLRGRSLGEGPSVLWPLRRSSIVNTGRWRSRDKRGRGPRKKNPRKCGGVGEVFLRSVEGGGTGAGPTAGGPAGRPEGPGRPGGPVGGIAGGGPRTMVTSTAGPRPGHTQGEGGGT